MTTTQKAIIRTCLYADIFSYPLTVAEIWQFLIGASPKYVNFQKSIAELVRQKLLVEERGFIRLAQRSKIVGQRIKLARIAAPKIAYAQKIAKILGLIPSVWCVGLSGALAMQNAPKEDDIDLFIITAPKTLWLTRLLAILLLDLLRVRRKPHDIQVANKICLNMFVESGKDRLPKAEQDLYSAHEIAQLVCLFNRHASYERFLYHNRWVKRFLPHTKILKPGKKQPTKTFVAFHLFEQLSKFVQLRYMQSRRTKEVIRDTLLRFHPHDAREWVLSAYQQRLKKHQLKIRQQVKT